MNMPMNLFRTSIIALALLATTAAQSALIVQDWMTAGDGYIIRDTDTNLEWLNLTQSNGLSYGYVSTQFGVGGQFEGMRYATNAEVINLWGSYFGIDLSSTARPLNPEVPFLDTGVSLASETLGVAFDPSQHNNRSLLGITADTRLDTGGQFVLGAQTVTSDTIYYTAIDPWYPPGSGWAVPTEALAGGSYLVRVVPVPAAVWLFGSGILALFGMIRRKQS